MGFRQLVQKLEGLTLNKLNGHLLGLFGSNVSNTRVKTPFCSLQVIALKESIQVDNLVASSISSEVAPPPPKPVQEMPESFRLAAPLSEGELTGLLLSSPLYQKLDAVKSLIQSGAGKGGVFHSPGE